MKPNPTSNCKEVASSVYRYPQSRRWPTSLSPLLRRLNTGTLALLMFVGFAVLSNTRGKDADDEHVALAALPKAKVVDNSRYATSQVPTESSTQTTLEPPRLFALLGWIFNAFKDVFDDPALAQYAQQQGIDTSGNQGTPCSDAAGQSSNSRSLPSPQSSKRSSTY
jgi:hypothetical protein